MEETASFSNEKPMEADGVASPQSSSRAEITCVNSTDLAALVEAVQSLSAKQFDSAPIVDAIKCLASTVNEQSVLLRELVEQDKLIASELRKIKVCVRTADNNSAKKGDNMSYKCKASLPLKSYFELLEFEQTMDKDDVRKFVLSVGGNTLSRMIANIVEAVYSIELQVATTWKGKKNPTGGWAKFPMQTTQLPTIIVEVCHGAFQRCSMAEVKESLQKYLAHGTDRMRKSHAKIPQM